MDREYKGKPSRPKTPEDTIEKQRQRKEGIREAWRIQENRDNFFNQVLPDATKQLNHLLRLLDLEPVRMPSYVKFTTEKGSTSGNNSGWSKNLDLELGQRAGINQLIYHIEIISDSSDYEMTPVKVTIHELAHNLPNEMLQHTLLRVYRFQEDEFPKEKEESTSVLLEEIVRIYVEGITELVSQTAWILEKIQTNPVAAKDSTGINNAPVYELEVSYFADLLQALAIELTKNELGENALSITDFEKTFNKKLVVVFKMLIAFARGENLKNSTQVAIEGQIYPADFLALTRYFLKKEILTYSDEMKKVVQAIENNTPAVQVFVNPEERQLDSWLICRRLAEEISKQENDLKI